MSGRTRQTDTRISRRRRRGNRRVEGRSGRVEDVGAEGGLATDAVAVPSRQKSVVDGVDGLKGPNRRMAKSRRSAEHGESFGLVGGGAS